MEIKKKLYLNILKAIFFTLMFAFGVKRGFADQVTGDVLYIEEQGKYRRFWMDTTHDGIEDTFIGTNVEFSVGSLLSRYIRQGGQVIFEKVDQGGHNGYNEKVIIYIIMPNGPETPENLRGRKLSIFDLFPNTDGESFPYAWAERNRQNRERGN